MMFDARRQAFSIRVGGSNKEKKVDRSIVRARGVVVRRKAPDY